jgi:hypothetical protein
MESIKIQQADKGRHSNNKVEKWSRWFVVSGGTILLVASLAKIVSAFGHAEILNLPDPVFGISFRHLLFLTGILELIVSGVCLLTSRRCLSLVLLAWIVANFALYRLGLHEVEYLKPCTCMGGLFDALYIPPNTADLIMFCIFTYLFIGSYVTLLLLWRQKHRAAKESCG